MTPFSMNAATSELPSWLDANVCRILTKAPPGHPEWMQAHQGRIGGHAAVNILFGNDPRVRTTGTPLEEWAYLTGKAERPDPREDAGLADMLRWGSQSEELHRNLLRSELDCSVHDPIGCVQSFAHPYLVGTIDGTVEVSRTHPAHVALAPFAGKRLIAELKAPSRYTEREWEDDVPLHARAQAAYYALITGQPAAIVSGLVPPRIRWQAFDVDPGAKAQMLERLCGFWDNHVVKDIPPDAAGGKADLRMVQKLHPKDDGSVVVLPEEFDALRQDWDRLEAEIAEREEERDRIKSRFAAAIGDATWGEGRGWAVSYKHTAKAGYVVAPSETRSLRRAAKVSYGKGGGARG